jgi:hypothetical protein
MIVTTASYQKFAADSREVEMPRLDRPNCSAAMSFWGLL